MLDKSLSRIAESKKTLIFICLSAPVDGTGHTQHTAERLFTTTFPNYQNFSGQVIIINTSRDRPARPLSTLII